MKKDKLYELKISEDDDVSGIDSISLVEEPAIEVNWVAFNKEQKQDFVIPDGDDLRYSQMIMEKGELEEDLFNDGWEVYDGKDEFISSSPNAKSSEDTRKFLIRYKYIKNPEAPGTPTKETTREFCRNLLSKNLVYRLEDLDVITNDQGSSAREWRGGYNCRHIWQQITYKKKTNIINKGSVTVGREEGKESLLVDKTPQKDTRVPEWPSWPFSSQKFSLPLFEDQESAEEYAKLIGCEGSHEHMIGDKTYYMPCEEHPEDMGYDNNLPAYVDPGIKKKKKVIPKSLVEPSTFENEFPYLFEKSYSDYPDSVKNNAKAVLKWVDENGWGSCGTGVGKVRANQLANGEPISLDTIKRMYSYLSRHEKDLESSKGYGDGCGKLMYDSWGGKTALRWAESKIKSAEKESMSKQMFQVDEEKRVTLGPAMIPYKRIFRKDELGNPYYVFFSPETIKMIAEKYMKNKYIDNNDENHDGKAVSDVYVIESWIKEDEQDKSNKYGFEGLPIGTWFVSMKINNDDVWEKIKNGSLRGYSVSGFFEQIEKFTKEEMFLYQLAQLLKNVKD